MECINCDSDRILEISAKCSDMCCLKFKGVKRDGYVPDDMGIGSDDYIEIDICLQCGMAQGLSDEPDPMFYTNRNSLKEKSVLCPECKGTGRDKHDMSKECSYCHYGIKS